MAPLAIRKQITATSPGIRVKTSVGRACPQHPGQISTRCLQKVSSALLSPPLFLRPSFLSGISHSVWMGICGGGGATGTLEASTIDDLFSGILRQALICSFLSGLRNEASLHRISNSHPAPGIRPDPVKKSASLRIPQHSPPACLGASLFFELQPASTYLHERRGRASVSLGQRGSKSAPSAHPEPSSTPPVDTHHSHCSLSQGEKTNLLFHLSAVGKQLPCSD